MLCCDLQTTGCAEIMSQQAYLEIPSNVKAEYTSASESQNIRENGRMDRDVQEGPGSWHHGTAIHEA